jgi:hypothetical protein
MNEGQWPPRLFLTTFVYTIPKHDFTENLGDRMDRVKRLDGKHDIAAEELIFSPRRWGNLPHKAVIGSQGTFKFEVYEMGQCPFEQHAGI